MPFPVRARLRSEVPRQKGPTPQHPRGRGRNTLIDPVSRRRFLGALGAAACVPSALGSDSTELPSNSVSHGAARQRIVETRRISRSIEPDPAGGLRLKSLKNVDTSHEWVVPGYADFAFASEQSEFEGLTPSSGFRLTGEHTHTNEKNVTELRLDFINPANRLKLSLFYASFHDTPVIEQWCRLENIGTQTIAGISRFDPVFFVLRGRADEFRVRAFSRNQYSVESWPIDQKLEIRGGNSSSAHAGFLAIEHLSAGEILFMGVKWERVPGSFKESLTAIWMPPLTRCTSICGSMFSPPP